MSQSSDEMDNLEIVSDNLSELSSAVFSPSSELLPGSIAESEPVPVECPSPSSLSIDLSRHMSRLPCLSFILEFFPINSLSLESASNPTLVPLLRLTPPLSGPILSLSD